MQNSKLNFTWMKVLATLFASLLLCQCSKSSGEGRQSTAKSFDQTQNTEKAGSEEDRASDETAGQEANNRYGRYDIGEEPPEQDALVLDRGYTGVDEKDSSIKINRERGDILAYDFCGQDNGHLTAAVRHTVEQIAQVVKEALTLADCPKEVVAALKSLQELDLSGRQVVDLSPLTEMTSLEKLNLNQNEIEDSQLFSLSAMKKLHTLSLAENKLGSIAGLASLEALENLDVSINELSEVFALRNLSSLKVLNLKSNQIQSIVYLKDLNIEVINAEDNPGIRTEIRSYETDDGHPCDNGVPLNDIISAGYCIVNNGIICFENAPECTDRISTF